MRRIAAIVVVAVVGISMWFVYSKVTQARRETSYHAAIAPFQRDLPIGTSRAEVEKYLKSRNIDYHVVRLGGSEADTYEIKISEEPGGLVCEPWNVYIALEFNAAYTLRDVHIKKIGTCL